MMSEDVPSEAADEIYTSVSKPPAVVAPTGKRHAFRDIRRQLEQGDLGNPGVQKMLLDDLERAEAQNDVLGGYIDRFHQADKRAAVLLEKLKSQNDA